jgi:hypothetical protein
LQSTPITTAVSESFLKNDNNVLDKITLTFH